MQITAPLTGTGAATRASADIPRRVRNQAVRLETFFDSQQIDVIGGQHKNLIRAYRNDPVLGEAF